MAKNPKILQFQYKENKKTHQVLGKRLKLVNVIEFEVFEEEEHDRRRGFHDDLKVSDVIKMKYKNYYQSLILKRQRMHHQPLYHSYSLILTVKHQTLRVEEKPTYKAIIWPM